MSNYAGLALWQTALADSILGYVAQMLKLLLGWGLALKDALVDEICAMSCITSSLIRADAPSVGASSVAAASAIARNQNSSFSVRNLETGAIQNRTQHSY
jgi:hypothetical protein